MSQPEHPLKIVGHLRSCFREKFGTPRQPLLVPGAAATLTIAKEFLPEHSLVGLERFTHVWLISYFHLNTNKKFLPKVHPPRGRRRGREAPRNFRGQAAPRGHPEPGPAQSSRQVANRGRPRTRFLSPRFRGALLRESGDGDRRAPVDGHDHAQERAARAAETNFPEKNENSQRLRLAWFLGGIGYILPVCIGLPRRLWESSFS